MKTIKLQNPIGNFKSYEIKEDHEIELQDIFNIKIKQYSSLDKILFRIGIKSIDQDLLKIVIGLKHLSTLKENEIKKMSVEDLKIFLKNVSEQLS